MNLTPKTEFGTREGEIQERATARKLAKNLVEARGIEPRSKITAPKATTSVSPVLCLDAELSQGRGCSGVQSDLFSRGCYEQKLDDDSAFASPVADPADTVPADAQTN